MRLVEDEKNGWSTAPSSCENNHAPKEIQVNFQEVYDNIILGAIKEVNGANPDIRIVCTRGEDLPGSGAVVSNFLPNLCRADITITDLTGVNPNVLFEYGIRRSVRDSLNILLCHEDVKLPTDIVEQLFIPYRTDNVTAAIKAKDLITATINHALPRLLTAKPVESVDDLILRTVELETGRTLERRLMTALEPAPAFLVDLLNELKRLDKEGKNSGNTALLANSVLLRNTLKFLETIGDSLSIDQLNLDKTIKLYELLTKLEGEGFKGERKEAFYKLNAICAAVPARKAEAQMYLEKAKALED
jgi:hypothetical protein